MTTPAKTAREIAKKIVNYLPYGNDLASIQFVERAFIEYGNAKLEEAAKKINQNCGDKPCLTESCAFRQLSESILSLKEGGKNG